MKSTLPTPRLDQHPAEYYAALDIDPSDAKDASLVRALHSMLANGQLALTVALLEAAGPRKE